MKKKTYELPEIRLVPLNHVDLLTLSAIAGDVHYDEMYIEFEEIFT